MPLIPASVDYTDKDFDSIRFRLRNLIRSVFPEWSDFNVANFGNILVELYANVGDVLTFYQDRQARQSRITTATQRKALIGLVKLIGYTPSTATAATVDVAISVGSPPTGFVPFPKGTVVRTEDASNPIEYQLLADATIAAGADPPTIIVQCENSTSQDQSTTSTGLPNQQLQLLVTPYIDGTAVVTADNGVYSQVDNFLDSLPGDRHFVANVDQNDRVTIKWGNGINGQIPVGTIDAVYKTGGGIAGRVDMNKLKVVEGNFSDNLGNPQAVTATNAQPSSGGSDRQSVAQIKERAPASLRVLNRSVAREDFEINARRLADVARALMLTSNEDGGIAENNGELYVVPVGGGLPSGALKDLVFNQITVVYPCTLTFDPHVLDCVYKDVAVSCVAYFRPGVNPTTAANQIRADLVAFFAPQNVDGTDNTNVDFGANIKDGDGNVTGDMALSDIFNVCRDSSGVLKLGAAASDFTLNGAHTDVHLLPKEFPRLGVVTILNGLTGFAV